jgi:O-antigen ligase
VLNGLTLLNLKTGNRATIFSLISNPNIVTNFYIISFPIILSTILLKKKTSDQIIGWFLLLFFSLGLFLTMSRTAVIAVLLGTLIFLFILRKNLLKKFALILVTILLLFIVIDPIRDFITLLFRIESGLTGRDLLWASSFQIIRDNPVFGLGLGAYQYEIFNYFPAMLNTWTGDWLVELYNMTSGKNISHSIILLFFSDMGVLGLLTVLVLPVIYFKVGFKTLSNFKNSQSWKYYYIVALFTAGATMFLRGIVDDIGLLSYGVISADLPFWLVFISLIHFWNSKNNT